MEQKIIAPRDFSRFARHLREEERSGATVEKYLRALRQFAAWLDGAPVTKAAAAAWKESLLDRGDSPATVNGKLTALDRFLVFRGWEDCRDVARLVDVLGHSSIETTRIYLVSTGAEHARTLEKLKLIS